MAESGQGQGTSWEPGFEGQRPPAEPGNELAVTHGAYADLKLGPRVEALADQLSELVPTYRPADQVAVRLLALSLARLERTAEAITADTKPDELKRLREDENRWTNTARRLLNDLGMTPMARSRLRLDVAMTTRALTLTGLVEEAGRTKGELEGPAT